MNETAKKHALRWIEKNRPLKNVNKKWVKIF
jgi:hypothetical protein